LNWRNFVPCLRTRLRDQIHRSSLSKMFLFLLVDFKFENGFWRIERGLKGMRFRKEWGLISYLQKRSKLDYFHWDLIKKMKRKINGVLTPRFILKMVWVKLFTFVWKIGFFLSISPRHSSKHTILNIHLNMHILAISKVVCVHVSVLVSVYIIRVHCPLHHILDTFYGLFAKKLKVA
jgi:hypothetical protein